MLLLLAASCQLVGSDKPCSGGGLDPEQAETLACVGWLDFVKEHTCRVVYVTTMLSEQPNSVVYGRASCRERSITVALHREKIGRQFEPVPFFEQLTTIVHKAAHLEDRCRNGEPPARAAERAFLADLEWVEEEEAAIIRSRFRSGNQNFDDLCLNNVIVIPGDP